MKKVEDKITKLELKKEENEKAMIEASTNKSGNMQELQIQHSYIDNELDELFSELSNLMTKEDEIKK